MAERYEKSGFLFTQDTNELAEGNAEMSSEHPSNLVLTYQYVCMYCHCERRSLAGFDDAYSNKHLSPVSLPKLMLNVFFFSFCFKRFDCSTAESGSLHRLQ